MQYDLGKAEAQGQTVRTGSLNTPPTLILNALSKLQAKHCTGRSYLQTHLSVFDDKPVFSRRSAGADVIFESPYNHIEGETCEKCERKRAVRRALRTSQELSFTTAR